MSGRVRSQHDYAFCVLRKSKRRFDLTKVEYKEALQKYLALTEVLPTLSERARTEVQESISELNKEMTKYEKEHRYLDRPENDHIQATKVYLPLTMKIFLICLSILFIALAGCSIATTGVLYQALMSSDESQTFDQDAYLQSLYDSWETEAASTEEATE